MKTKRIITILIIVLFIHGTPMAAWATTKVSNDPWFNEMKLYLTYPEIVSVGEGYSVTGGLIDTNSTNNIFSDGSIMLFMDGTQVETGRKRSDEFSEDLNTSLYECKAVGESHVFSIRCDQDFGVSVWKESNPEDIKYWKESISGVVNCVPEPSTMLLLGSGLVLLRRRRRA